MEETGDKTMHSSDSAAKYWQQIPISPSKHRGLCTKAWWID